MYSLRRFNNLTGLKQMTCFKFLSHLLEPQAQKGKWKQVKSPSTWHSHYFRCVALKDIVIMTTGSHREGNDAGLFCIATDLSCVLWQNSLKDFFQNSWFVKFVHTLYKLKSWLHLICLILLACSLSPIWLPVIKLWCWSSFKVKPMLWIKKYT